MRNLLAALLLLSSPVFAEEVFRCFNGTPTAFGQPEAKCFPDHALRNIDKGHRVTVFYLHNGKHVSDEGKLLQLTDKNEIKLEQVAVLDILGHTFRATFNNYIKESEVEFVLIDGNGEPK